MTIIVHYLQAESVCKLILSQFCSCCLLGLIQQLLTWKVLVACHIVPHVEGTSSLVRGTPRKRGPNAFRFTGTVVPALPGRRRRGLKTPDGEAAIWHFFGERRSGEKSRNPISAHF